jgi:hypothetical protein
MAVDDCIVWWIIYMQNFLTAKSACTASCSRFTGLRCDQRDAVSRAYDNLFPSAITFDVVTPIRWPMTPPNPQKVGGEYGDVRATIDLASLNRYLVDHCPFMKAPVQVKQFKVRSQQSSI